MKRIQLVLAILLGGALLALSTPAAGQGGRLDLGSFAPEISGPDLNGASQLLSDYRGKWVYVDFWASWCPPCIQELANTVALHDELAPGQQFSVFSVSLDDERTQDALLQLTEDFGISYPVIYEGKNVNSENARAWGVRAIPATFLLDPQGRVVARDIHPAQVRVLVSQASRMSGGAYQPITVKSSERLLADSPTTGRSNLRDLQLTLDMQGNSSLVSKYQVYLETYRAGSAGRGAAEVWQFDLDVVMNPQATDRPYFVEIRETSSLPGGAGQLLGLGGDEGAGAAAAPAAPEMSVAIDAENGLYQFIIPVPADTVQINYVIALYDELLGQFVGNGRRFVDTSVN